MKLGFIGLGKMGRNMVIKLLAEGHQVVVWNRTREKIALLRQGFEGQANFKNNLIAAESIEDLVRKLEKPRVIWSMLPAGEATQEILDQVEQSVEEQDIVIDGGNANYQDTQRRYEHFAKRGIKFLGIGVSGGLIAAKEGYPLMVGGDRSAYDQIKPILDSLAKSAPNHKGSGRGGSHHYFGEGGAGHFVKMVHNGIEYGMMQAIGEGFGVLEKSPYKLDLLEVAKLYGRGTIIAGFLMDRVVGVLTKDPQLSQIEGYIEESGEGRWTVEQAKKENVPAQVIESALNFRTRSQQDQKVSSSFAARLVAALRNVFGGHQVKRRS